MQGNTKPGFVRRGLTAIGTLIVIAGAGAAVSVGADILTDRAAQVPPPVAADITPVSVRPLTFEDEYMVTRRFLGQVEANTDVAISFELGGRLAALPVEEGAAVTEGEVIAQLDTALLEAENTRLQASRDATLAQLNFAETRLTRATELLGDGFSSQETLDQARATRDELVARIAEIDAALRTVAINLEKSVIHAPFSGSVGTLAVEANETLGAGQHVLTLIETTAPIVRVGLPLDLSPDMLENATIEIDGQRHDATLKQLRPDIDPVTRTRTALFRLSADIIAPAFGQTATLLINAPVLATGAWVPVDALQEGAGSIWTILVVDDGIVRTAAVELLHVQSDRALVRGTFAEGAQLISTGAHRLVPGQKVAVLAAEG
ncbi:MAG: efflux RND transporter periplasmic adaptor subunit [Pseudomonadota bacterium]